MECARSNVVASGDVEAVVADAGAGVEHLLI